MTRNKRKTATAKSRSHGSYLKFRTRWRHVLLIDERIRSGRTPNCRQLAEELEVSRRTILRDIDFMRYDLEAPVEYDPAKGGYVYTEANWVMPSVRITEGELFALMVAERALEAYSGTPWAEKLQAVFERMISLLPDRIEVAPRELLPRVSFDAHAASTVEPQVLDAVGSAIRDNRTLRIRYTPLGDAEAREYTLDPYVLRRAQGAWYLAGKDHRSGRIPMFNLTRVRSVKETGETFDYDASGFDPEAYFDSTFGVHETSSRYRCAVEFSGAAAHLVRERQWHPAQKLKNLSAGRVRLEVEVSHLNDIWPWVLSWGAEAKVIRPKELVLLIAEQAKRTARQYPTQMKSKRSRRQ